MIKSRGKRLAGHVTRMVENINAYSFGRKTWGKSDNYKEQYVDGKIILKWISD
jgi:hypothetical protein